jgi:hypothetical protein
MTELGLKVRYPKKFKVTTDSDHNDAISANKLDRQFTLKASNKAWTTDITYTTKYLSAPCTTKAARYFLLNLGHPNRIFSGIIGKRHAGLCHEAQDILFIINRFVTLPQMTGRRFGMPFILSTPTLALRFRQNNGPTPSGDYIGSQHVVGGGTS